MGYKVNHYARPVNSKATFGWEAIFKDLSLALVSTVMCYFGYRVGVILLVIPMGIVALMFYVAVVITFIGLVRDYRSELKQKKLEKTESDIDD
jgi:hypothetical protein